MLNNRVWQCYLFTTPYVRDYRNNQFKVNFVTLTHISESGGNTYIVDVRVDIGANGTKKVDISFVSSFSD
jgi:hypothetical protein